jgi:hypothetical protein
MRASITCTAVAALSFAVVATPSMAAAPLGFAGTLDGAYGQQTGGGSSANLASINGAGAFGFSPFLGAELDAGYNNISVSGASADMWNFGGSAFWAAFPGRAGVTLDYASLSTSIAGVNVSGHATTYGAFGEFFLDQLTLGLKGGGLSGGGAAAGFGASGSGGYVGGAATGYITPDFALSGTLSYLTAQGGHSTDIGVSAEFLFSHELPVSVFGGYVYDSSSGTNNNVWQIGIRFYTSGTGNTLIEHQRNGTLGWIGNNAQMLR